MRLQIRRTQQSVKGMLGGHKGMSFTLTYRLELTPDETELVDRYRLGDYPLTFRTVQGTQMPDDTVTLMQQGRSQTVSDVTTLLKNESIIKNACDSLPALFEVCRTFGGEEIVNYPRKNDERVLVE